MRVVPDNTHCMRHACSHPMDRECPHCALEGAFYCRLHGTWQNRKDCPHCVALRAARQAERTPDGWPVYDKDDDRIGSGRGYGGGQGVSRQGPSSPFD